MGGPETPGAARDPVVGAPGTPSSASAGDERAVDLRMARLHLRMGSLELARAELEASAGAGELDTDALLDLAEVRWRTGDLAGAGVAANAYLANDRDDVLALVIAAEASAGAGHPGEARLLVARVLGHGETDLDAVFAGMPRSWMWPLEPTEEPASVSELFPGAERPMAGPLAPPPEGGPRGVSHRPPPAPVVAAAAAAAVTDTAPSRARPAAVNSATGAEAPVPQADASDATDAAPDLRAARSALAAGDAAAAADRLAELLRARPDLSNAVLEALDRAALRPDARHASDEPTDVEPDLDGEP